MGLGYDPTALTARLNDLCILVKSPSLADVQAHMYRYPAPEMWSTVQTLSIRSART
jgi:hypothetical protein